MNIQDFREKLKEDPSDPLAQPLEVARNFLRSYCSDADSMEEVRAQLERRIALGSRGVQTYLAALDALLADPPADGTLAQLVAWDANWVLDDPSDKGAVAWLRDVARMIRDALGDKQLSRP